MGELLDAVKVAKWTSIKFRMVAIIAICVLVGVAAIGVYVLHQFEEASTLEISHEGVLLSDMLEATLTPLVEANDVEGIQRHIDRLTGAREINDIEINVMFLTDDGAYIVASNISDNVEIADPEEYDDLDEALSMSQVVSTIEFDEFEEGLGPDDPDYYFVGQRHLTMMAPLLTKNRTAGINVKLSLGALDRGLSRIRGTLIAVGLFGALLIVGLIAVLLNKQIFAPLHELGSNMASIAEGHLNKHVTFAGENEISVLARSFNHMSDQLSRTQKQLFQYLNPMAIEEAYRRAAGQDITPSAQEKILTVFFIDIVSFTSVSERLGPSKTVAFLNSFYDEITVILQACGGAIDKFVADEIVCLFDQAHHAQGAVDAAQRILDVLSRPIHGEMMQARIGINTGFCMVADVGSHVAGALDRTVIGDTVNTAQRLMASGEPNSAIISDSTFRALQSRPEGLDAAGRIKLKGKKEAVKVYRLTHDDDREAKPSMALVSNL